MRVIKALLIFLMPITCAEYQELRLISKLNNFFEFDHNIFLLDSSTDFNRFICNSEQDICAPQTIYSFKTIDDQIYGSERLIKINSKNTLVIVVPGTNYEMNIELLNGLKRIQRIQINMKIGVLFPNIVSSDDLHKLFTWCWEHRIINVFATSYVFSKEKPTTEQLFNIFTFNPFGTFDIINVGGEAYDNFFLIQNSNFKRHPLLFGDEEYIRKSDKMLWLNVCRILNTSCISRTADLFVNVTFDISPVLRYMSPYEQLFMYPMLFETEILVVPEALPYPELYAYFQAIASNKLVGVTSILIVAVISFLYFVRYIKHEKSLFMQSVVDTLNLLINDNLAIKYQKLSRIEVLLIVPMTFVGFIIVNGIFSSLQSHLTRPINQPQINTIDEIYRSKFSIFTFSEPWAKIINYTLTDLYGRDVWKEKIRIIDVDILQQQIETYNTSISFVWNIPTMNSLLKVQRLLNIKGYHLSQVRISTHLGAYRVNAAFPFTERLNEIVHRFKNAGLYQKWYGEQSSEMEKELIKYHNEHLKSNEHSDIHRVQMPNFILYGWFVSIVVFAIEIIYKKFKPLQIFL